MRKAIVAALAALACGCAALNKAAFKGDIATVRRLVDGGADIDKCSSCTWEGPDGSSAVGCAGHQDRVEVVRTLFAKGADPNACLSFYFAAMSEDPEIVRAFLKAGGDPNRAEVMLAVKQSPEVAQMLVDAGGDPLRSAYNGTILEWARKNCSPAVAAVYERAADPAFRAKRDLQRQYEQRRPQVESLERQGDEQAKQGQSATAVAAYAAAYKLCPGGSEAKDRLFAKLADAARLSSPAPAIPAEAQAHADRAEAFIKLAKNSTGFAKAAEEFEAAIELAPWWAEAHYNLGLAREKAGDPRRAVDSMKQYLIAAPESPEADSVKRKIVELQVAQELR